MAWPNLESSCCQCISKFITSILNLMKGYHTSGGLFRSSENVMGTARSGMRKLYTEEIHEVGDYGLLHKAVSRQMKRKKKKKNTYSDCASHCQSLDKLQQLNAEKNDQIRRHIYEKAEFQALNQELKQMMNNPTMREHQLHLKIAQLEEENRILKERLQRQSGSHRQELQRIRNEHKTQIQLMQNAHRSTLEQHYHAQVTQVKNQQHRTTEMQPKVEVSSTKPIAYESRTYLSSQSPQIVVNKPESSPKVHVINSSSTQQYRNYVAGSPVYISSRQEEAKPITRAISPDNSKETTSQTRVYRGDSPQIITSYPKPTTISRIQPLQPSQNTRIELKPEIPKGPQGNYLHKIDSSSYSRGVSGGFSSFGQGDMQQIYRKYCISD